MKMYFFVGNYKEIVVNFGFFFFEKSEFYKSLEIQSLRILGSSLTDFLELVKE